MTRVLLEAKDGKRIAADVYDSANGEVAGYIVYAHMMPSTKESWENLAENLEELGYIGIAFDLRGHGESDGGPDGYVSFTDEEHQESINDLEAATEYLISKGGVPEKTILIGASISANLSLQYIVKNPAYKTAILLSTGLNYKGIEAEPLVKQLQCDQKVLFVSSRDDDRTLGNNVDQNQKLFDSAPECVTKGLIIYENAGHGTTMLQSGESPDLKDEIIKFIKNE